MTKQFTTHLSAMQIKDIIKYYIPCRVQVDGKEWGQLIGFTKHDDVEQYFWNILIDGDDDPLTLGMPYNDDFSDDCRVKPVLRPLDSMTEEEMIGLLQSMVPDGMPDKPEAGDWNLDMFYNDGGNLVDEDVAVGAEYTCICDIGQIVVRKDGSIEDFGEAGTRRPLTNLPRAIHYLLSRGFDLFGGINAGWAVDVKTIN